MENHEIKAMVSLLDDTDLEVVSIIENKIRNIGIEAIEPLEQQWKQNSLNPTIQSKIGDLIHYIRIEKLYDNLKIWRDYESENLLKGLWLVCTHQFPDVKFEDLHEQIKEIFFSVWIKTTENMHPHDLVKIINEVLFDEFKFESNIKNFHAVSNSMFNQVLDQRKGNPLALSCIYILISQLLKIPIYGVNLPSLFVLIFDSPVHQFYINAFNQGRIFNQKDKLVSIRLMISWLLQAL